ncbi:hypothetical protein Heshes_00470 [Alicyclobacillus hesperidum]|uniref:Magnesium transporter MgtE intracellular domain-containing protein n=1 Tax=Alicyclobacillus hesperidum TaxID=89784 RepID=A0AA37U0U0_9BACL|nr:hypothetical protein [Alicyclobacillus hesperidum]GLV12363.1 hypothetical protein Heshes_00470 [Alicyclobacillus hesperidum]
MAIKQKNASTADRVAEQKDERNGHKFGWILLVIVIPLLVALAVLVGALQVLGVPVWKKVSSVLGGHSTSAAGNQNATASLHRTIVVERAQIMSLQNQVSQLTQEWQKAKSQNSALAAQVKSLKAQLATQVSNVQQGTDEAKVLAQMDASAAALVLEKMPLAKAAWAVAEMTPDVSGPILQALPTATASSILQQAAVDERHQSSSGTSSSGANAVGNGISGLGGANSNSSVP